MGKSRTPKYVVEISYICFTGKRRKTDVAEWSVKNYGKITEENLKTYRQKANESIASPDAINGHLHGKQSAFGTVRVCLNTPSRPEICRYTPPMFEEV